MKYEIRADLPHTLREVLPEEAQDVYLEAYAAAWKDYDPGIQRTLDHEAIAHRDAWETVLKEFEQDSETGEWRRRGEKRVEEPKNGGGLLGSIKRVFAR
jgi:cation transport regulator